MLMIISTLESGPSGSALFVLVRRIGHDQPDSIQIMHAGDDGALRDRFIREAGLAAKVAALIEPALADRGFRLVRVADLGPRGQDVAGDGRAAGRHVDDRGLRDHLAGYIAFARRT